MGQMQDMELWLPVGQKPWKHGANEYCNPFTTVKFLHSQTGVRPDPLPHMPGSGPGCPQPHTTEQAQQPVNRQGITHQAHKAKRLSTTVLEECQYWKIEGF